MLFRYAVLFVAFTFSQMQSLNADADRSKNETYPDFTLGTETPFDVLERDTMRTLRELELMLKMAGIERQFDECYSLVTKIATEKAKRKKTRGK